MELIAAARLLWRWRRLVLVGLLVAAGAAVALGPSPTPPRGFAATGVVLDTARSQFADDAAFGADTLTWRAALTAQTLGTADNRRIIAAAAGIPQERLEVSDVELSNPLIPASLPRAAVKGAYSSSKPYTVDLHTEDSVPIIAISANAPDRASAVRLAEAMVRAIKSYTSVPADAERLGLEVRTVTPIDSVEIPGGHGRKKMAAVAVAIFCIWLAALALLPGLIGTARKSLWEPEISRS